MTHSVGYVGLLGRNSWDVDYLPSPSHLPHSFTVHLPGGAGVIHNRIQKRCGHKRPFKFNLFTLECLPPKSTFPLPPYPEPHGRGSVLQLL